MSETTAVDRSLLSGAFSGSASDLATEARLERLRRRNDAVYLGFTRHLQGRPWEECLLRPCSDVTGTEQMR